MKQFRTYALALSFAMSPLFAQSVFADETVGEKVGEVVDDTKKVAKKGYRKAKDGACEMINGKMECAGKKLKHKAQNTGDEIKDKADDVKKKID